MYLDHFGLKRAPYHITPDPGFFCFSPSHREALATIAYFVDQREGFMLLTGEVGTGKTTVLRTYMERVDRSQVDCLYIFDPDMKYDQLLHLLFHELGFDVGDRPTPWMLQWLHWVLVQRYQAGRNVVVIIDEAQNMPVETLERLRMLSNLETTTDKLIQILLVGQPELDVKFEQYSLRQLKQRIAMRAEIRPLTPEQSIEYLRYRAAQAGAELDALFTAEAVSRIVRRANGIPRTLNILASNALMSGFGAQVRPVPESIVREVIEDLEPKKQPHVRGLFTRMALRAR